MYSSWPFINKLTDKPIRLSLRIIIIHIINSPYNFSIQSRLQNSDRVQFRFHSPEQCIITHLKNTKLYSIEVLNTGIMSDHSNYQREYSPDGSFSPFELERSDVIPVLKNSLQYSFVFFKCLQRAKIEEICDVRYQTL